MEAAQRIAVALSPLVGAKLAAKLVDQFLSIRTDFATKTLGRASPGKFVETFVQCLQFIAGDKPDASPAVDNYLDKVAPNEGRLPESLRTTASRIARSIYTVRNKRDVAHNGEVDANLSDLAYVHHAAVWIVSELVRLSTSVSMDEAGRLVALLHAPVSDLVEDIDGVRLVHGNLSVKAEVLILLHSHFPDPMSLADIKASMSRRGGSTVGNMLRDLQRAKQVHAGPDATYKLTAVGYRDATKEIDKVLQQHRAA